MYYMYYSDRDKSWPICDVISQGKSVKTYPDHWKQVEEYIYYHFPKMKKKLSVGRNKKQLFIMSDHIKLWRCTIIIEYRPATHQ